MKVSHMQLEGMADIYMTEKPPFRKPIPLMHPGDRIGTTCIPCGIEKIASSCYDRSI